MHITFYMSEEDCRILEFDLIDYKSIENCKVTSKPVARVVLKNKEQLTIDWLHYLLHFYMGGEYSLEGYIEHIKEYGFYTPYQRNLRIKIEE